jgi:hypothetical protein
MNIQDRNVVLITCSLIFILATAFCIWTGNQTRWPDELDYVGIAKRLVSGFGFVNQELQPSAFRPPGYPFVIFLIYQIHESILLAKIVNVFALSATAWLLSLIVKAVAPGGRIFAPLLVLIYPLFIYSSSVLVPQILGGFMFVLVVYLLIKYPKLKVSAVACGVTFGVLILMIPYFSMVFFCLTALLFIVNRTSRLYNTKFIALFLFATVLVVGPWVVRSSLLFDKFVFISTNSGINLLYGNSENAGYDTGVVVDISKYSNTKGMNEAELDGYYKKSAISWVVNHPADAAGLYLQKVVNYFNFKNKLGTKSEESLFKNALLFFTYYPLLIVVVVRCTLWRQYKFTWPELLLYILYFGNAFLSAIFFTRIRFRVPFDFLLVAMVSIFIGYIRESKRGRYVLQTHSSTLQVRD